MKREGNNRLFFNRHAYFFSLDAFIALLIVLGVVLFIKPTMNNVSYEIRLQDDLLQVLSDIQIGQINNSYINTLRANGTITKLNQSVLEQVGEFYAYSDPLAQSILESIFSELDLEDGLAVYFGGNLVANSTVVDYSNVNILRVSRQIISGIEGGHNASSGYSSRAFLFSENKVKYFYLGGYVGDGNITVNIGRDVLSAIVEADFSGDFEIYINGVYANSSILLPGAPLVSGVPFRVDLLNYSDKFLAGENNISFRSISGVGIGGGFIRVMYNSSDFELQEHSIPGIKGLINLYDGIYIPGNLMNMSVYLHYNSSYNIFMSFGGQKVYFGNSSGVETNVTINNATLFGFLNYSSMIRNTIPFRIGFLNVTDIINAIIKADVFSVTDLSGSMADGTPPKIDQAIEANKVLVDVILNYSNNMVGLVGYSTTAEERWYHKLSNDNASLYAKLDSYGDYSYTCICCGVNRAIVAFNDSMNLLVNGGRVGSLQSRVSASYDDAEEESDGDMDRTSSDLEMTRDGSSQLIGMRFQGIDVPPGAIISSAYIEFETDETNNGVTHLTFSAEDVDDAGSFLSSDDDISNRVRTNAKVTWSNVPAWNSVSEKHQTPDLSSVIQEVVDRGGWNSGNSLVVIVNGTGERVAESYNGESQNAPLLVLTYQNYIVPVNCSDSVIDFGEECDDGNSNNHDNCTNECLYPVCGDGFVWNEGSGVEECENGGICTGDNSSECYNDGDCAFAGGTCTPRNGDGCSESCELEERFRVMMVMSDGEANRECAEQGVTADLDGNGIADEAEDDAIQAACDAYNNYGITVYTVGFGGGAGQQALQDMASCGHGNYYFEDVGGLADKYREIAQDILSAAYEEQKIVGAGVTTELFADSKISFDYISDVPYGLSIISETPVFGNAISQGDFFIPDGAIPYSVEVVSYSGSKWTRLVEVYDNSSGLWDAIYNLSDYNLEYTMLGDPYVVNIPLDKVVSGNNTVRVSLGTDLTNSSGGSPYDKVIYSIVKNMSAYSPVCPVAQGCIWHIQFEDNTNETMVFPPSYAGTGHCYFANESLANSNDAINIAILNLFKSLDLNSNKKIETKFDESDMSLSSVEIAGLPFAFETEVQVRAWK